MSKKVTDQDDLKVIDMMTDQVRALINDHWLEISKAKKENEGMIAVAFQTNLDYNGEERAVKTTISFSVGRIRDSRQDVINPNQMELPQ